MYNKQASQQHLQQHFVQQASSKQQLQQDCPMPPLSLAANKVATYPPKKGHNRLIGVATKWTIAHLSVRSNSKIERDLRLTGYCVSKTLLASRPPAEWGDSTEIWWRWWCLWLSSNPLSPMRGGQRPNIEKRRPHVDLRQRIKHLLKEGQCREYHKRKLQQTRRALGMAGVDKDLNTCVALNHNLNTI